MEELQLLKEVLFDLGIPVIHKQTEESPRYITYHFDLPQITDLSGLDRKIKFITAYIHKDVQLVKSKTNHFALRLPNEKNNDVKFENPSSITQSINDNLGIYMGIDDNSNKLVVSLKDMPHILIAGTTGSGKSVMLNSIICGFLKDYQFSNYYLIDTKKVELSQYKQIKGVNVATNPQEAIEMLDSVCEEMDNRYAIMEEVGVKNKPEYMPDIVVVIEELNDLMIASKKVVEQYIVRIAQLGRACGVHLIIATQHPVVATLTGAIKANIGCRLALKTTSATDSINILGHKGAEQLKGKGDALLKLPTESEEIHLQCPYITDKEIKKIVEEYNG